MHQTVQNSPHVPVLVTSVLQYLAPQAGESYLDLTAGYGGHAAAVLEQTQAPEKAVLVDRDATAVRHLRERFVDGVTIIQDDFAHASQTLAAGGQQFDMILADLGVSSLHLDMADRGFTFQADGPLDMRMDQSAALTAGEILNTYSAEKLTAILLRYGEEPKAHQIARRIMAARPLATTGQLAAIVIRAWPGHKAVHPATRTFQALRIAVNDELGQIERSLPLWTNQLLAPSGRLAVISFHSLEDRLVKSAFHDASATPYDATLRLLTKHPVTAGPDELVFNPRARSAKLRAVAKINIQKERSDYADPNRQSFPSG